MNTLDRAQHEPGGRGNASSSRFLRDQFSAAFQDHLQTRAYLVGDCFSIAGITLFAYVHCAAEGGFDFEPLSGRLRVAPDLGAAWWRPALRSWAGAAAKSWRVSAPCPEPLSAD
jgi:glutathione S-transferase